MGTLDPSTEHPATGDLRRLLDEGGGSLNMESCEELHLILGDLPVSLGTSPTDKARLLKKVLRAVVERDRLRVDQNRESKSYVQAAGALIDLSDRPSSNKTIRLGFAAKELGLSARRTQPKEDRLLSALLHAFLDFVEDAKNDPEVVRSLGIAVQPSSASRTPGCVDDRTDLERQGTNSNGVSSIEAEPRAPRSTPSVKRAHVDLRIRKIGGSYTLNGRPIPKWMAALFRTAKIGIVPALVAAGFFLGIAWGIHSMAKGLGPIKEESIYYDSGDHPEMIAATNGGRPDYSWTLAGSPGRNIVILTFKGDGPVRRFLSDLEISPNARISCPKSQVSWAIKEGGRTLAGGMIGPAHPTTAVAIQLDRPHDRSLRRLTITAALNGDTSCSSLELLWRNPRFEVTKR
jgi:hypothetical protein